MPINFKDTSLIESLAGGIHEWTTGTGSIGIFTVNGSSSESQRLYDTDPFGNSSIVWQTNPDAVSGPDGGWNTDKLTVDPTKLYRFSVWIKRATVNAAGSYYFGTNDSAPYVLHMTTGAENTNPYWDNDSMANLSFDVWYLFVGHVFPVGYRTGTYTIPRHPKSGQYTRAAGKVANLAGNNGGDMVFQSTVTSLEHRTYHFYSTVTSAHLQFFDPRIELCDGSERTVASLLAGPEVYSGNTLATTSITWEGAMSKTQNVQATGGDMVYEFGEWRTHIFTGSGTFDLQSYVGSAIKADYLIVAGGGGGGARMGGGGGGGGVLTGYTYLTGNTYTITVGAGGAGATAAIPWDGSNGGNSTFNGLTALGGGGGGGGSNTDGYSDGKDGGCGGGGSGYASGSVSTGAGGSGTVGQGFDGGDQGAAYYCGSGGGASEAGSTSVAGTPATGGTGTFSTVIGRPYYWGGGGGSGSYTQIPGAGGLGGGGGGADTTAPEWAEGGRESITWGQKSLGPVGSTAAGGFGGGRSGGGGGGGVYSLGPGGDGGSGIVVIKYKYK